MKGLSQLLHTSVSKQQPFCGSGATCIIGASLNKLHTYVVSDDFLYYIVIINMYSCIYQLVSYVMDPMCIVAILTVTFFFLWWLTPS